jgi:SAM-dependent methyltransferase
MLVPSRRTILAAVALVATAVRAGDVPYLPTPPEVVRVMLEMAEVRRGDVVYDLGCGDGRIVIAAVQAGASRGVCVEIDPVRIAQARENVQRAGLAADRIHFVEGDLFQVPIADATVVTLYLMPSVNERLRPRLLAELRPGTRVVSHDFDMGTPWKPEREKLVSQPDRQHRVFRWTVPESPGSTVRRP